MSVLWFNRHRIFGIKVNHSPTSGCLRKVFQGRREGGGRGGGRGGGGKEGEGEEGEGEEGGREFIVMQVFTVILINLLI